MRQEKVFYSKQTRQENAHSSIFQKELPGFCNRRDFTLNKFHWAHSRIKMKTRPLPYQFQLSDGRIVHRHIDQLISIKS